MKVTEAAAAKFKEVLAEKKISDAMLRVSFGGFG
jgi:Fe-S cluster assembly iron-binding protein IscA